jgi:nitrogen-specific signal transduction histidine kinase
MAACIRKLRDSLDPSGDDRHAQHHELQILFDINTALHSSPHLKDVLQQALLAILHTLKFKMGVIYLVRETLEDEGWLDLVAQHGFSSKLKDAIQTFSVSVGKLESFRLNREVRWLNPSVLVFPALRERMNEEGITEIICIPLMSQKRVLGLLYVTNDGILQLKPERNEFLTTIGYHIGVAIENAQLFDSVERAKTELEISFDAIQHSILVIDQRQRVFRANRTCEGVYGNGEDLIGRQYSRLLYGVDEPPPECPIECCFRDGLPIQREGPHPRWGGFYYYYAFPVFNSSGTMARVVYYEKDATESKKLEQRMHQSERLKALGTLAAGIAHEIRNPLATINFNTQMLQRELNLDSAQHQMFDDMVQEVRKIDRIVQQVLHFARPREPQFCPNALNDIVGYCFDLAKVSLRKASVEVSLQLASDLPLIIMDYSQISQVIMNLIINGIESMPNGGKLVIRTARPDGSAVVLEVGDTGCGILDEDRNRIFDPFFTRKPEGTGLGLSISRQIVEKHGAYIEIDSRRGEGTIFRIVFPEACLQP